MAAHASPSRPAPARIADLTRAAADYVARATGCAIDLSEESLAFVDHYLSTVRAGGRLADEALALIAAALGVHLGEVAIAKFGGLWRGPSPGEGEPDDPASWRVELGVAPLSFDPVGMAAEALRQEPVPGYDAGLRTRPELTEALEAALARAAPVSDEYYYSLTGRLETVAYAAQIVGELLRQQRAEDEAPAAESDLN